MKQRLQPLIPAALYARVSSDCQDVDLSVAAQLGSIPAWAGEPPAWCRRMGASATEQSMPARVGQSHA